MESFPLIHKLGAARFEEKVAALQIAFEFIPYEPNGIFNENILSYIFS